MKKDKRENEHHLYIFFEAFLHYNSYLWDNSGIKFTDILVLDKLFYDKNKPLNCSYHGDGGFNFPEFQLHHLASTSLWSPPSQKNTVGLIKEWAYVTSDMLMAGVHFQECLPVLPH